MPKSMLTRPLAAAAIAAVVVATVAVPAQAGGHHRHRGPDSIAHHGAAGAAPENTLAAIELALDQDADFVEVEVQRSADGELVVVGQLGLAPISDAEEVFPDRAPWFVGDFTLSELKQLDAGSWFGPEYAGAQIPTLAEVIDEVGYRDGLVIDITNPLFYPGIEAEVHEEIESRPWYEYVATRLGNLAVKSSNAQSASTFHELAPNVPVGVVYGYRPTEGDLDALAGWVSDVDVVYTRVDAALVDQVHRLDMNLQVHTVNDEDRMAAFADLGVDGIVTEEPAALEGVLD